MSLMRTLLVLIFSAIFVFATPAHADCIGDTQDAVKARATTPRVAPSASVAGAPVPTTLRYDFERTVESATCAGAPGPNEARSYHFTAELSFAQFMDVYWPYASRIFQVEPSYRSFQLTSKTFVRLNCTGPCGANPTSIQNLKIELSVPARGYKLPLTASPGVDDDWTRETFVLGSRSSLVPAVTQSRNARPSANPQPAQTTSNSTAPQQPGSQASLPLCKKAASGAAAQAAAGAVAKAGWALGGRLGGALWSGGNAANRAAQEQERQDANQQPGVTCRAQ
jgi:hypothetical protein